MPPTILPPHHDMNTPPGGQSLLLFATSGQCPRWQEGLIAWLGPHELRQQSFCRTQTPCPLLSASSALPFPLLKQGAPLVNPSASHTPGVSTKHKVRWSCNPCRAYSLVARLWGIGQGHSFLIAPGWLPGLMQGKYEDSPRLLIPGLGLSHSVTPHFPTQTSKKIRDKALIIGEACKALQCKT